MHGVKSIDSLHNIVKSKVSRKVRSTFV